MDLIRMIPVLLAFALQLLSLWLYLQGKTSDAAYMLGLAIYIKLDSL